MVKVLGRVRAGTIVRKWGAFYCPCGCRCLCLTEHGAQGLTVRNWTQERQAWAAAGGKVRPYREAQL